MAVREESSYHGPQNRHESVAMGAKFNRCVLHIGTEKTGTTSLQTFLHLNRRELLARGVFVPVALSPYRALANHEHLTTFSLDADKLNDDLRVAAGVRTSAEVANHRSRVAQAFREEVSVSQGRGELLFLSNEHCHSRLVRESEVRRLAELLSEFAEEVSILVYIRPQHELAVSLYDQALRAGYYDIDILPNFEATHKQWVTKRYFDYDDLTTRWSDVFSFARTIVRIFASADFTGPDVISDVMAQIGCDMAGLNRPKRQNTSIGADFQPVLNVINRVASKTNVGLDSLGRNRLAEQFRVLSKAPSLSPSRSEAERFLEIFKTTNERVRRKFFPTRERLFDIDLSTLPESNQRPAPEIDLLVETIIRLSTTAKASD